jgi:hypothetical protein
MLGSVATWRMLGVRPIMPIPMEPWRCGPAPRLSPRGRRRTLDRFASLSERFGTHFDARGTIATLAA